MCWLIAAETSGMLEHLENINTSTSTIPLMVHQGVVTPIRAILRAATGVTNFDRLNLAVTS